jgi:hypothetical protein
VASSFASESCRLVGALMEAENPSVVVISGESSGHRGQGERETREGERRNIGRLIISDGGLGFHFPAKFALL